MVKTKTSNSIERFLKFLQSQNFRKVASKETKKTWKDSSPDRIFSSHLGKDVFLSPSGQVKIDNLDSCQKLVSSDFIVFPVY